MTTNRYLVFVVRLVLLLLMVFAGPLLWAQPGDPGGDPDQVPITGLEYLIGGGAVLGIRTLLKRMKQKGD